MILLESCSFLKNFFSGVIFIVKLAELVVVILSIFVSLVVIFNGDLLYLILLLVLLLFDRPVLVRGPCPFEGDLLDLLVILSLFDIGDILDTREVLCKPESTLLTAATVLIFVLTELIVFLFIGDFDVFNYNDLN